MAVPHMQRCCNCFQFLWYSLHWLWVHDLKQSEYICEEFGVSAISKSFKGYWGNCEFYNFFVCQKEKFTRRCSYSVLRFFQIAKSKSRSMCGLDVQIWKMKIWQLCHQCIQIIFFYIRCIDNCREPVLKIIQVPQFSFWKNVKEQIWVLVPSLI